MRATFYNVGHGEAIFIDLDQKNGYGILRDFGRAPSAKHTEFSCSIKRVLSCCCCHPPFHYFDYFQNIDAVLSHAHEDHFNGFEMLYDNGKRDIFQNSYIPWLSMSDLNSLGGFLIHISLFLFLYYGPNSIIGKNAKHWLLATPILAALSKRLWGVSVNHTVNHWGEPNKILWPPVPPTKYIQSLISRWDNYKRRNNLPANFLSEESEEIRKMLSELYSQNSEQQIGLEISIERSEYIIKRIIQILVESSLENQKESLSSPIGLYSYAYKPGIDNHSLIFEIGEKANKHLYLSDADDKTVKKMLHLNGIKNQKYYLIKSGHHGNRGGSELLSAAVKSDNVVNCCGPANSYWKGPDLSYTHISNKVFCTDWHNYNKKWINKSKYNIHGQYYIRL